MKKFTADSLADYIRSHYKSIRGNDGRWCLVDGIKTTVDDVIAMVGYSLFIHPTLQRGLICVSDGVDFHGHREPSSVTNLWVSFSDGEFVLDEVEYKSSEFALISF